MFIATESTPNPATLKFLPQRTVLESGTRDFSDAEAAKVSPLAEALFAIEGVNGVFFGEDFISVTKSDDAAWDGIKTEVMAAIMEHFVSGAPLLRPEAAAGGHAAEEEGEDELVAQIKAILDQKVRPAVARDGGDIVYRGFSDGIVYLHMQGACSGCPSSTATLKHGIENLLRYYLPEINEVRAIG
ncbi:MAG: NifU family protein [Rhodothalassiaceae bacterium]